MTPSLNASRRLLFIRGGRNEPHTAGNENRRPHWFTYRFRYAPPHQ
jgi:hypothetical protein